MVLEKMFFQKLVIRPSANTFKNPGFLVLESPSENILKKLESYKNPRLLVLDSPRENNLKKSFFVVPCYFRKIFFKNPPTDFPSPRLLIINGGGAISPIYAYMNVFFVVAGDQRLEAAALRLEATASHATKRYFFLLLLLATCGTCNMLMRMTTMMMMAVVFVAGIMENKSKAKKKKQKAIKQKYNTRRYLSIESASQVCFCSCYSCSGVSCLSFFSKKLLEGGQQGVGSVVEMWHNSAKEAANSVCVLLVSECGAHVGPPKQKVNELHIMWKREIYAKDNIRAILYVCECVCSTKKLRPI